MTQLATVDLWNSVRERCGNCKTQFPGIPKSQCQISDIRNEAEFTHLRHVNNINITLNSQHRWWHLLSDFQGLCLRQAGVPRLAQGKEVLRLQAVEENGIENREGRGDEICSLLLRNIIIYKCMCFRVREEGGHGEAGGHQRPRPPV